MGSVVPDPAWAVEKRTVMRLLEAKWHLQAAEILETVPFELREGTNGFNDEFCVLYYHAPLDRYVAIAEEFEKREIKLLSAYRNIADAMSEIGHYARFILLDLDSESADQVVAVTTPSLEISSDSVQRALADAEALIRTRGAASGVDRIHTAFHGHLRNVATKAGISYPEDRGVTQLFKLLRAHHPAFVGRESRGPGIDRVLNSMAAIVDALNPIRNRASGAHPNELVLQEPEAMLVINGVKTLLHYLDARLRESGAA